MNAKRLAGVAIALVVAFSILVPAQRQMDSMRTRSFEEELLYLPNQKLLNHFTGGMNTIIADLLWLKCIQYTSEHFRGDGKFVWLNHMCNTITRLDPYFVDVYHYGSIFLAALDADSEASLDLLHRGIERNPDSWELPYDAAMVYLINRRDDPDAPEKAAHYLTLAAAMPDAPGIITEMVMGLRAKYNLFEIERAMWADILQSSDDKLMKEMAERKLIELTVRETVNSLNALVNQLVAQGGERPRSLEAMVSAGILREVPADPLGGRYFIDADGIVQNTTLLDDLLESRRSGIQSRIDDFKQAQGRWPESLDELVETKYLRAVPAHPVAGESWRYDPATGTLR